VGLILNDERDVLGQCNITGPCDGRWYLVKQEDDEQEK
jgi:hypothetical protein